MDIDSESQLQYNATADQVLLDSYCRQTSLRLGPGENNHCT